MNGDVEAVLLAFIDNGLLHYFQGGFNPAYAKESLGTVMIGLCLKDCVEAKDVREFDFMGGEADYKAHWTKATRETIELEWIRQGVRSLLYTARVQAESFGRSIGRATVPAPVRAAGRRLINKRQLSNKRYALPVAAEAASAAASNFLIRTATGSDLERVKALIAKMSPGDVEARYKWLYESNPHGRALTWVAIEQRDRRDSRVYFDLPAPRDGRTLEAFRIDWRRLFRRAAISSKRISNRASPCELFGDA